MTRPKSVQDVLDALRRDRLVEPAPLSRFLHRHDLIDGADMLRLLVADRLLTEFQAEEIAAGRGAGLWLGGYRVISRLGKGGMGNVYLAEHAVLGRRVAVKALSDSLRADPGARRRFVREARAAAALDHPNIVHVVDVNMTHDPPYLVMEYVDGVSLQAAVARAGTFSTGEAAAVGIQVGDGLARAAAVGLVHRDIKPANLLIDRRGGVKILDLGIVRFAQDDAHSRVHATDLILGTLDYLAPEQAEDSSNVDPRADLYSLGASLYFLLAGHPPFTEGDLRQKLAAKRTVDPPPIQQLRPDVPRDFSTILQRLLARNPADRYPTPAAVVAALHPWAAPGSDFPARLFRHSSESTSHELRRGAHSNSVDPMPDTLRIIKPLAQPPSSSFAAPSAPATPGRSPLESRGGDTENACAGTEKTDEIVAVPEVVLEQSAVPDTSLCTGPLCAKHPRPSVTTALPHAIPLWRIVVPLLAALGVALVALLCFAKR